MTRPTPTIEEVVETCEAAIRAERMRDPQWRELWGRAFKMLAAHYRVRPQDEDFPYRGSISVALRMVGDMFDDHAEGIPSPLGALEKVAGRPKSHRRSRNRFAFLVAVAALDLKIGKSKGRSSDASFDAAARRINKYAKVHRTSFTTSKEIRSAWNNRSRLGAAVSLANKLAQSEVPPEPWAEAMAESVAQNSEPHLF